MDTSASHTERRDAWNEQLAALRDDAKAIESSMQAAQAVVRQHAERLNGFNRVVCLPAEVLEPIFLAARDADPSTGPLHHAWSAEAEWVLVSHVCRRWRQVAIGYTNLWTDIDIDQYGIPFCKEMLSRVGSREFSLSATVKAHQDFLFDVSLRKLFPSQLSGLTLKFDDNVTQPGAFLDTLLSHISAQSPVLRELQMICRTPADMYWASLERVYPSLTSLSLSFLYPGGRPPTRLPMLTDLSFSSLELTSNGPESPGILDLLPALPVLESLTFINCSFSPLDAPKAVLPLSMELVYFDHLNSEWSLQQCRAISRALTQSTGYRVFAMSSASPNVAEEIFSETKDAVELGLSVHEVTLELTGWATLDATIEFECHDDEDTQAFCIEFNQVPSPCWPAFCSSVTGIDMRDANLRVVCDKATPYMFAQNHNFFRGLRRLTVSAIYLTGRISSYPAINLFAAMRESPVEGGDSEKTTLAFPALRDVCIEHSPLATTDIRDLGLVSAESVLSQLDENALYLLWYTRARREHDLQPLRTVALPSDLLQKHWAIELDELLERRVVSYDVYIEGQVETDSTECRAVVLYRPVLRALRVWEKWVLTFAPVIGTLGILWTSSRRR